MKEINGQTLAATVEILNKKLDEIIKRQKDIENEIRLNNKVIMQRMNKTQEYNEIDDMRCKVSNTQLNVILKKLTEIDEKLY